MTLNFQGDSEPHVQNFFKPLQKVASYPAYQNYMIRKNFTVPFLKYNSWSFRKFKVALNPLRRIFLNFAKSCILSCWLQFDNKKWGSPSSFLSYKCLKLKLRVLLAGHIVALVTYCATKLTATCSPMIGQFVDTMILASTGIEWL